MREVFVEAENGSYAIKIERGLLPRLGAELKEMGISRAAIVTDETVNALYGAAAENSLREAGIQAKTIVLPAGEHTKSQKYLYQIYDELAAFGVHRADALVALGGGVIGDLAGFAAATYMRGIGFIQVPTTLLAQVDSSVGGKTAIDLPQGKNLVGAFYQPQKVLIDPDCLMSLSEREFKNGLAEVVKYGFIYDAEFYRKLNGLDLTTIKKELGEIVARCCTIKKAYVEQDTFDKGARMALNFGHTVGHAIELGSHGKILHGEAVAHGMLIEAKIGQHMGVCSRQVAEDVEKLLQKYQLLDAEVENIDYNYIEKDKKFMGDALNLVVLKQIGEAVVRTMDKEAFFELLRQGGF